MEIDFRLDIVHLRALVLNLHLDSTLGRVCGNVERIHRLLEWETVCDEGSEVDEAARNEPKGFGVLLIS